MTALLTGRPSACCARSLRARRIIAEISCGRYSCSPSFTFTSWPILRLIDLTVRSGASTHWLRAAWPTRRRPSSARPTKEGRMGSPPCSKTCGWPSAPTRATSLLVVPRSMPTMGSPGGSAGGGMGGSVTIGRLRFALASWRRTTRGATKRALSRKRLGFGDAHLGEAEHAAAPEVAAAHLADHLAGRPAAVADDLEDFHPLRV